MTKKNNKNGVVKNSSETAISENDWYLRTYRPETMTRILEQIFDDANVWATGSGRIELKFRTFSVSVMKTSVNMWYISNVEIEGPASTRLAARTMVQITNALENAETVLLEYKSEERFGFKENMVKAYDTLIKWGLTPEEIAEFNYWNDSYLVFKNK